MELSKVLDSQVSSGLTDKIYRTNINEIQAEDDKQTSELYEVNIFGNVIQIAPGLTIKDTQYPKLVYCYVYAILKNKVKAKLGIVEDLTTTPPVFFDISLIEDGRLRLFDVYEQNPDLIKELEYVQNTTEKVKEKQLESGYTEMNENVFDYFIREIKDGIPTSEQYKEISEELKDEVKREKDKKTNDEVRKALDIYKKSISEEKAKSGKKVYYFNKNVINDIRKYVNNINTLSEILFIIYVVLKNFNVIVIDENESVYNMNKYRPFSRTPENESFPYLVVQWKDDMPMLIGKYDSYKILPQKYTGIETDPIKRPRTVKKSEVSEAKPSRKTSTTTTISRKESEAAAPPLPPPPAEAKLSKLMASQPFKSLKEIQKELENDNNDEYPEDPIIKKKSLLSKQSVKPPIPPHQPPPPVVEEIEGLLDSNDNDVQPQSKKIPNPKSTQRLKKIMK
jgi:hypothetical protein